MQRACSTALEVIYLHPRKTKTHRESFDLGYCAGLMKGVYENLTGGVDFCPPDGASLRKITELTVNFVKAHPELKDKDSADIVRWATVSHATRQTLRVTLLQARENTEQRLAYMQPNFRGSGPYTVRLRPGFDVSRDGLAVSL